MLGDRLGIDETAYRHQHPRIGELAFDSDRKLMSTLHNIDGVPTLYTKGPLMCSWPGSTHVLTREGRGPLTPSGRNASPG